MNNIQRITKNLQEDFYNGRPHDAAADVSILSGEFAYLSSELANILTYKASIWTDIRKTVKSDTACERAWQKTPDGIKETSLKLQLKSIEKMMSALRTVIRLSEIEYKHTK
jgi:hypothetical protein